MTGRLVDLAARRFGGAVLAANDESFAPKESLIRAAPPTFTPRTFGPRGQVYDGWETRRRREPGHDWALVRLGAPGVVRQVVVDTAYFVGNFPERCWLEGRYASGHPAVDALSGPDGWTVLLPPTELAGDALQEFAVAPGPVVTHVRLAVSPDGGVARLRVLGEVVPDPRRFAGLSLDLAALENGGRALDSSNAFYSAAGNALLPGHAVTMGEGWETTRRRGAGNDWLLIALAGTGRVHRIVLDTTHFLGNAPGAARVRALDAADVEVSDPAAWEAAVDLVPRTPLQPDTPHGFPTDPARTATHLRVDVYPDGGLARVRAYGHLTPAGREALALRWWAGLPADAAEAAVLAVGLPARDAADVAAHRHALPAALRAAAGL